VVKRREFIRGSLLSALAAGLGYTNSFGTIKRIGSISEDTLTVNKLYDIPLAVATWPNLKATEEAMKILRAGGRALDAVEGGARVPEADPDDTSVGYGGLPDRDGYVTLDACIMDEKGNAGAVTFLPRIMHPVSVARKVMELTPHVMLSGDGALQFAREQGFEEIDLLTEKSRGKWEEWKKDSGYKPPVNHQRHDTIGILAMDKNGDISGACTTSGLAFKYHGRVGDSPIIGAGLFVDNEIGGACATGVGELVMKTLGSFLIVELMRNGIPPQEACETAIQRIVKKYPVRDNDMQVGVLALNKKGEIGAFSIRNGYFISLFSSGQNQVIPSTFALK
jgi:N4-(beta-N-acetylglucosaminyl)-L-asparaginase